MKSLSNVSRWRQAAGCCLLQAVIATTPLHAESPRPSEAVASIPIKVPDGFLVEEVYRIPREQGSWVCLTVDPKGRLITSDQFGKLYRVKLPGSSVGKPAVEALEVGVGGAQGLLWAFNSLYVVANRSKDDGGSGLYQLRSVPDGDHFEAARLLLRINGEGEHGPHAVVLGPDQHSLYLLAGNATYLPELHSSALPRNWGEDRLLPHLGQSDGVWRTNRPGGWVLRLDPDGTSARLLAAGVRNPYDLAFNADGELFTFDADMEWDVGTPWYRPTRINHVTSAAEFGWRTGSSKWPDYYTDSQPAVLDVGESSPTGLTFGYGAKFPARYQRALFMGDWSYGKIFALHLRPQGSTYTAELEQFLSGSPLPVTDLVIHPRDGSLYFLTGGRKTASILFRVSYRGGESTAPAAASDRAGRKERRQRQQLERLHEPSGAAAVKAAWPFLKSNDRALRYAARIAVEHQPLADWEQRALSERHPRARLAALMALVRCDPPSRRLAILRALRSLDWPRLERTEQLELLRIYGLVCVRMGKPEGAERQGILDHVDSRFPESSYELNRELCELLVALEAPGIVERVLGALREAPSQEEQLHYVLCLRTLDLNAWSNRQQEQLFNWFAHAGAAGGGVTYSEYLGSIRLDCLDKLAPAALERLSGILARKAPVDPYLDLKQRRFVKEWKVEDLLSGAETGLVHRNFESGRKVFSTALCVKCHRFNRQGGMAGPDLTGVGNRFDNRTLLESILEPSKVVSDQYATVEVTMKNGESQTGRIGDQNDKEILLKADLLNPANIRHIPWSEIESVRPSALSLMPTNLLDSFTREEILDLLAYLKSQGNPGAAWFRK